MATHLRCGTLFTGLDEEARPNHTIVFDGDTIAHVGPTDEAPLPGADDTVIDHGDRFVMPGLIDVHTHLSYGNAKTEEDIDLYGPVEFKAIRGLNFAQRVLRAGYTAIANPGDSGRITVSIRHAIDTGLFVGPRITTAGAYITSRQGLTDWYPTWIGQPVTSIGHLVCSPAEAIEEIRVQVKDGVDFIKLAMDGDKTLEPTGVTEHGGLMAAFNQEETTAMVTEAHRLGKRVAVHARGTAATLYSARAGADLIFHASFMDDEGLDTVLENGCALCPTLTLIYNNIEFSRPGDGAWPGFVEAHREEFESACEALTKARKAGATFMTGTDTGFAITPYGEWHAREIEIFVKYLGFSPGEALRCATFHAAKFLRGGDRLGAIEPGRLADVIVVNGNPLENVAVLQQREAIETVYLGGKAVDVDPAEPDPRLISDFSYNHWNDVYTRQRIAELNGG